MCCVRIILVINFEVFLNGFQNWEAKYLCILLQFKFLFLFHGFHFEDVNAYYNNII